MSYFRQLGLIIVRRSRHSIYLFLLVSLFTLIGIVSCFFRNIIDNYQNSVVYDIGYSLMLYRTDGNAISQVLLDDLSQINGVVGCNQETNMLVQPVDFKNTIAKDENNIFSIPHTDLVRLYADTDTSLNLVFKNSMKLMEGNLPSSINEGVAIDEVLASENNLTVGDTIVVRSLESGIEKGLKIIGIYKAEILPQESWTEGNGTIAYGQSPYSYIFCDFKTYENVVGHEIPRSSVVIYADNMRALRKITSSVKKLGLSEEEYHLVNQTENKLKMGTSASRAISSAATLLTSISVFVSGIVLFLVILLWIRACYKDISILIALGKKRCAIIRDYLLLISIISIFAIMISTPFCGLIISQFGDSLVEYTFAASGNISGLGMDNYMAYALDQPMHIVDYLKSNFEVLTLIWLATFLASIKILRCNVSKLFETL